MATYTNEYSRFPEKVMEPHRFKDVDDEIGSLVNQIKMLQSKGQFDKVNEIVKNNTEGLSQYALSAEYINAIDEEIRNLQIYAKAKKQSIFSDDEGEPQDIAYGDVWLSTVEICNVDVAAGSDEKETLS